MGYRDFFSRNRKFESISLQGRVRCEPDFGRPGRHPLLCAERRPGHDRKWGERLGEIVEAGATLPLAGEP
jgi:hypothetical protein